LLKAYQFAKNTSQQEQAQGASTNKAGGQTKQSDRVNRCARFNCQYFCSGN